MEVEKSGVKTNNQALNYTNTTLLSLSVYCLSVDIITVLCHSNLTRETVKFGICLFYLGDVVAQLVECSPINLLACASVASNPVIPLCVLRQDT